jgi:two-component system chemotaxis response regulator CheB
MNDRLKILIVDDSPLYRQMILKAVSGYSGTEVIGTAPDGKTALSLISASRPDLVLMDIDMPIMDGIEALKAIRSGYPGIDVVMVSGIDRGNASMTMRALSLGALDFVAKPQGNTPEESLSLLRKSLGPLVSLVMNRKSLSRNHGSVPAEPEIPAIDRAPGFGLFFDTPDGFSPPVVTPRAKRIGRIKAVGIGVSTGGPIALQTIIPSLDSAIGVPILAVQHMPSLFTALLAERLNRVSKIAVEEARDGIPVEAGKMYIAPGDSHLMVLRAGDRAVLRVDGTSPVNNCRPSVDVLFRSMAALYGGNVLAVILTGMGKDGVAGVEAIRRKGGYCIVQDKATSVVWGMARAVIESRDADEVTPLEDIARRITEIVRESRE